MKKGLTVWEHPTSAAGRVRGQHELMLLNHIKDLIDVNKHLRHENMRLRSIAEPDGSPF